MGPLRNFIHVVKKIILQKGSIVDAVSAVCHNSIKKLMWIGLDNEKFAFWKFLDFLWYRFGPTVLVMNRELVPRLLALPKVDMEDGYLLGNLTSESVGKFIGTDNIFHPRTQEQHSQLRQVLVDYFKNRSLTKEKVQPLIMDEIIQLEGTINIISWVNTISDLTLITLIFGKASSALMLASQTLRDKVHKKFTRPWETSQIVLAHEIFEENCINGDGLISDLSDEEQQQMAEMLMVVGQPNLASALCSLLLYLAQYPEEQERCRTEPFSITSGYSSLFFNEVMRLAPPVWIQARKVKKAFTMDDITFPKGSLILIPKHALNTDPNIWEEPQQFNPERVQQGLISPFSTGPNRCAGRMMAEPLIEIIITTILQHYRLTLKSSHIKVHGGVALGYKGKLEINFERLNCS